MDAKHSKSASSVNAKTLVVLGFFLGIYFWLKTSVYYFTSPASYTQSNNPRLFGFSSYVGGVVNLTFNDTAVVKTAEALGMRHVRYPGGSISNFWNLTSGRWVDSYKGLYPSRTNKLPIGTFTPENLVKGYASNLPSAPLWNLNVLSLGFPDETLRQVDTLVDMVGLEKISHIELGNEKADKNSTYYIERITPLISRIRERIPRSKIGVIFCFSNDPKCRGNLKKNRHLFDAVVVHKYFPGKHILDKFSIENKRTATLATILPMLWYVLYDVGKVVGPGKEVWLNEFNWGGNWEGAITWKNETHGALRGLTWAAYVIGAIHANEHRDRTFSDNVHFSILDWYSLFYQEGAPWSYWSSCVKVSTKANTPSEIMVDGTSQIFSHFSAAASKWDEISVIHGASKDILPFPQPQFNQCVQIIGFSNKKHSLKLVTNTETGLYVALNTCSKTCGTLLQVPINSFSVTTTSYSASSPPADNMWTKIENIPDITTFPWKNGPLSPKTTSLNINSKSFQINLPPVSLTFIEFKASSVSR